METNIIIQGDALSVLKSFPDYSIDCVITSPPYWQLRDYGWSGQWGLEPTFEMYLTNLWSLMDEIFRVLKSSGTVWVNLGDTYSKEGASGGNGNKISVEQIIKRPKITVAPKCLLLIPSRFGIGCIDRGWIVRNDIIWAKRNAMPESVTDRFSKKYEHFFFMTKSGDYYFDIDSIRDRCKSENKLRNKSNENYASAFTSPLGTGERMEQNPLGKNPGDVSDFWNIPTNPSNNAHYATYNAALIDKPIMAGCPKDGIVLDPFCGTATTGCRAIELSRQFIGIEGNPEYVEIGNKKLHPHKITQHLF